MGYSAKNTKQILEQKIQEEHLRAEAEKKRLIHEKEKLLQERKGRQQLDRKINRLSCTVIEAALTDR